MRYFFYLEIPGLPKYIFILHLFTQQPNYNAKRHARSKSRRKRSNAITFETMYFPLRPLLLINSNSNNCFRYAKERRHCCRYVDPALPIP